MIAKHLRTQLSKDQNLVELLRNSGLMYGFGILSIALTFLQQITTANLLGVADYGRLAAVLSAGALLLLLLDFRTWEAANRFLTEYWAIENYEAAARVTFWLLMLDALMGLLASGILFLLSALVADQLLYDSDLFPIVQLFALSLFFRLLGTGLPPALLRLYNRFDWLAIKSVVYAALRLILMSGAAWNGLGLAGVLLGSVIADILHTGLMLALVRLAHRRLRQDQPLLSHRRPINARELTRVLRELWLGATLKGLQAEIFVPLLALTTTPVQVGFFRSGLDVATLVQRLVEPLTLVIQPQIAKLYTAQNHKLFVRYLWQMTILLSLLTMPFVTVFLFAGHWIYPRLLGEGFAEVTWIGNVLMIALLFPAIFSWLRPAIMIMDLLSLQNWIGFIGAVASIVGLLIVVPVSGAVGAAWVLAFFHIGYVAASYGIFYHRLKSNE